MAVLLLGLALVAPAPGAAADPISPVGRYRLTTTTAVSHLVINADLGCIDVGRFHSATINSAQAPGPYACPAGVVSTRHARRLPV